VNLVVFLIISGFLPNTIFNSVFSHETMHLICLCGLAHSAILGYSIYKYLVMALCDEHVARFGVLSGEYRQLL
jgi:uncharacterized protein YbgA (DUF1722 family)